MKEKISVIIPVYKVEKYLKKCIDSVINQTYKNLEIIVIDDGSPDKCGQICDEYANIDERIKVIHKKNGGLSDARNFGLKIAKGKYICFVDSDDYIELDMIENLYKDILKNNSDISVCNYIEEFEDSDLKESELLIKSSLCFNKKNALIELVNGKIITNHVCNKLFKVELFNNIFFPKGLNMEDVATTYRIFEKCKRISCIPNAGYHYIQRSDSIVNNKNKKLIDDTMKVYFERNKYLQKKYDFLNEQIIISNIKIYKLLYFLMIKCDYKELYNSKEFKKIYIERKKDYWKYKNIMINDIGKKSILSYDLFYFNKYLYYFYIKLLNK